MKPALKLVPVSTDAAIRDLLTKRDAAEQAIRQIDRQLQPLRRAYADERGEAPLPTIDRLRRDLGQGKMA